MKKKPDESSRDMKIVETSIYTRQINALIDDDAQQELIDALIVDPAAGDLIRGSGGLRKLRWASHGRGKSGGIRVIYYWSDGKLIYLLLAYPKNEQSDLTSDQLRLLRELVEEEKKSWKKSSSKT